MQSTSPTTHLLLFGDQAIEKLSSIQTLVHHSRSSSLARSFLNQATDVVQLEFARLSKEERGWEGEIPSLLGLAEENVRIEREKGEEKVNGIVATVLMCIGRIGELCVFAEEDPLILGLESSPTRILAFCTGMLPAAVAAAATDTSEVLHIGLEMIKITFRLAYAIIRRMKLVENVGSGWATILGVGRSKLEGILAAFHAENSIPEPRKVAIGVETRDWLTLVGPPSSLRKLWAWSTVLDEAAKTPTDTQKTVFLLPDGSGSAMVYSQFPHISDSVCVVALNSLFLIDYNGVSISFNTSIEGLCLIWVEEIRRRQPHGPYILGRYSAGGYYAFEVAKQLRREGESVEKLILIDSPCRVEFGAPQMETTQFLSEQGMLGDWGAAKKTPGWFVKHFQATIEAVDKYMPTPMREEDEASVPEMPEVFVIWATKGNLEDVDIEAEDTGLDMSVSVTRFMLEGKGKTGFGLHGWDRILPGARIWEGKVLGNHFTLVHRPNCNAFRDIFRDILEQEPSQRRCAWEHRQSR